MAVITRKKLKVFIIVIAILLCTSLLSLAGTLIYNRYVNSVTPSGTASDNIIANTADTNSGTTTGAAEISEKKSSTVKDIYLHNKNTGDNVPFNVNYMMPGDTVTQNYNVKISYHDNVTIHFKTSIRNGYEELGEVMKVRVIMSGDNKVIYDGAIKDMPESVTYKLSSRESVTQELNYKITAYLDTSAGNEFMDKRIEVDLSWWAEETGHLDSPQTGDILNITLFIAGLSALAILLILYYTKRRSKRGKPVNIRTSVKLAGSVIVVVALSLSLCVTSFALVYVTVSVDNNIFHTGKVDINLNDGKPVISEHEFLFEPGLTVKKDFFIENNSTSSVYYKLYFDNVKGGLADILEITIKDGDSVLYTGTVASLSRGNTRAAEETLQVGGRKKTLSIYFHYPEDKGNETQDLNLIFDMAADAVQAKNNPNREF